MISPDPSSAPTPGADPWLTITETAQQLNVHHQTVRLAIRTGALRASKIGRHFRIRQSEIDAWLERSTFTPAS